MCACMCGLRSAVCVAALLLLRSALRVLLVTHVADAAPCAHRAVRSVSVYRYRYQSVSVTVSSEAVSVCEHAHAAL